MNLNARIKRLEDRVGFGNQLPFILDLLDQSVGGMTREQTREFESMMSRSPELSAFLDQIAESDLA